MDGLILILKLQLLRRHLQLLSHALATTVDITVKHLRIHASKTHVAQLAYAVWITRVVAICASQVDFVFSSFFFYSKSQILP